MTCQDVLALIAALPLAEQPPSRLEAAERHATSCGGCRAALADARALESLLAGLPEPAPPADLARIVMARLARVDQERPVVRQEMPRPRAAVGARGDRAAWAASLLGVAIAGGAQWYGVLTGESTLGLTWLRAGGGMGRLIELAPPSLTTLMVTAGLLLYVVSFLWVPLRDPSDPESPG
jgi:hypothetical protein